MELKGKIALVTGGSRGIGRVIAEELAARGAHVYLGARNMTAAEAAAESILDAGGSATAVELDVARAGSVRDVFKNIPQNHKLLDILVNNAGITRDGLIVRMKEEDWDEVLSINLKGAFLCTQQALKQMMKQKQGTIVNVASIVGLTGNFGQANYTAAKAGLIGLTRTVAREAASRGITVNAVAPGFIDTDMTRGLEEKIKEEMIARIPLGRFGTAQDVADSVGFLVSGRARYITGQVININGGMLM